jgi:haloalkane dehalogenase
LTASVDTEPSVTKSPTAQLHGNPTFFYLWRNIIPHVTNLGRCIAPDLMAWATQPSCPKGGPASYTFVEHRRYLDALPDQLGLAQQVTFVIHDWALPWASTGPTGIGPPSRVSPIWKPSCGGGW